MAKNNGFRKGDRVIVKAEVYTKSARNIGWGKSEVAVEVKHSGKGIPREMRRVILDNPFEGMVVGHSVRITGLYFRGGGRDDPGEIADEKWNKVVMVIPLGTDRWINPVACLEDDLELLTRPNEREQIPRVSDPSENNGGQVQTTASNVIVYLIGLIAAIERRGLVKAYLRYSQSIVNKTKPGDKVESFRPGPKVQYSILLEFADLQPPQEDESWERELWEESDEW